MDESEHLRSSVANQSSRANVSQKEIVVGFYALLTSNPSLSPIVGDKTTAKQNIYLLLMMEMSFC